MNQIRKIIKDLDKGVAPRKNLPIYANYLADTYLNYASIELVFSAYMLVETCQEGIDLSEEEERRYDEVRKEIPHVYEEDAEAQKACSERLDRIRGEITQVMEKYTSYTDQLICYDYVLKHRKFDFEEEEPYQKDVFATEEDVFVKELMAFLVGNKDQSIVKERLQQLMGMIPVHMTKQRLMGKIQDTGSLYIGGDMASLDNFIYMIRSAAMIQKAGTETEEDAIADLLKELQNTDFAGLTKESFEAMSKELEKAGEYILHVTDFYYQLQKVVNAMYALSLANCHKREESALYEHCRGILMEVANGSLNGEGLVKLEGKIEPMWKNPVIWKPFFLRSKPLIRRSLRNSEKARNLMHLRKLPIYYPTVCLLIWNVLARAIRSKLRWKQRRSKNSPENCPTFYRHFLSR